jgi:hypothetical protein
MIRRLGRIVFLGCLVTAALLVTAPALEAAREGPMRILLLVDSSSAVSSLLTHFRAGLHAFLDAIPENAEVTIVTTGGQLRLRIPATTDRQKLHDVASGFAQDGGANSMLETMLEADRRFLKVAPDRWPVIVILSTDSPSASPAESRIDAYNKFMNDFLQRGGMADAFVIKGGQTGFVTDISMNLTTNTGGKYEPLAAPNALPDRMKAAGQRLKAEYDAMHAR